MEGLILLVLLGAYWLWYAWHPRNARKREEAAREAYWLRHNARAGMKRRWRSWRQSRKAGPS